MNEVTPSIIDKIREVRRITGCNLKEAKDAVEECGTIELAVKKLRPKGTCNIKTFREMDNERWAALFYATCNREEHMRLVTDLTVATLREAARRIREVPSSGSKMFSDLVLSMID